MHQHLCVRVCVEEDIKVFDEVTLISGYRCHMGTVKRAHRSAPISGDAPGTCTHAVRGFVCHVAPSLKHMCQA